MQLVINLLCVTCGGKRGRVINMFENEIISFDNKVRGNNDHIQLLVS